MLVHQHRGYVQSSLPYGRITVDRGPWYFAVCMNCSWQGPDRFDRAEAERDADAHVATTGIEVRA